MVDILPKPNVNVAEEMEQSSECKNLWISLHSVSLSDGKSKLGINKTVTLVHHIENPDFVLVDIRGSFKGRPSKNGICLTQYEFDWLSSCLLLKRFEENKLISAKSARSLTLKPRSRKSVEVTQLVNDKMRRIMLYGKEIKILIEKCGTFMQILEDLEERENEEE